MLRNRTAAVRLATLLVAGLLATTTVVTPVVASGGMTHSAETTHATYASSTAVQTESDCLEETVDRYTRHLDRVEFRLDVLHNRGHIDESTHAAAIDRIEQTQANVEEIAAQEDVETARDLQAALVEQAQANLDEALESGEIDEETHETASVRLDLALERLSDAPERTLACEITDELEETDDSAENDTEFEGDEESGVEDDGDQDGEAEDTSDASSPDTEETPETEEPVSSTATGDCLNETVDRYTRQLDRVEFRLDILLDRGVINESKHAEAIDRIEQTEANVEEIAAQEDVETVRDLQTALVEQAQANLDEALESGEIDEETHEIATERLDIVLDRLEDAPPQTLACEITDEIEENQEEEGRSDGSNSRSGSVVKAVRDFVDSLF
jgi:hypothetical protein